MLTKKEIYLIKAEALTDLAGIFKQAGPPTLLETAVKTHASMCAATKRVATIYLDKAAKEKE